MNVGLPGAGIGGLFYLLCALAMPIKEVFLTITRPGHKFRYRLIATQLSIAIGIVLGVVAIYKLVSSVLGVDLSFSVHSDSIMFYSLLPVLISFGLLLVILTSVRLVGFFSNPHKSPLD
jgi:hypothetical protein